MLVDGAAVADSERGADERADERADGVALVESQQRTQLGAFTGALRESQQRAHSGSELSPDWLSVVAAQYLPQQLSFGTSLFISFGCAISAPEQSAVFKSKLDADFAAIRSPVVSADVSAFVSAL